MSWESDKRWSDRFLPEIKSILGQLLIGEPPVEEDEERNTDLIVLRMEAVRICCRVRRNKFIGHSDEFTIRTTRPAGTKTELDKIVEGYGSYFFYGICDPEEQRLASWFVGNLNVFRLWFTRYIANNQGKVPGILFENHDKSSSFRVYKIKDVYKDFVIARKNNHECYPDFLLNVA